MQYVLLIYEQEERYATRSQDEMGGEMQEYIAYGQELAGAIKGCSPLQPTTTARGVVQLGTGRCARA